MVLPSNIRSFFRLRFQTVQLPAYGARNAFEKLSLAPRARLGKNAKNDVPETEIDIDRDISR